jgi:hypothetical protein
MSYPLSRIERGIRGELLKAMKIKQLWTFSQDFFKNSGQKLRTLHESEVM